jgi:hypothetical protein
MPDTTTAPVSLIQLDPGETFTFGGKDYVLVKHRRSKSLIRNVAAGTDHLLASHAKVVRTGKNLDALSDAINQRAARAPKFTMTVGQRVRIVDDERTRRRGIAGVEAVIERVNSKTYSLSNGWRVSPDYVEAV